MITCFCNDHRVGIYTLKKTVRTLACFFFFCSLFYKSLVSYSVSQDMKAAYEVFISPLFNGLTEY